MTVEAYTPYRDEDHTIAHTGAPATEGPGPPKAGNGKGSKTKILVPQEEPPPIPVGGESASRHLSWLASTIATKKAAEADAEALDPEIGAVDKYQAAVEAVEPAAVEAVEPELHDHEKGRSKEALMAEAITVRHLLTHMPKNSYCDFCRIANIKRKSHKAKKGEREDKPTEWGQEISADTFWSKHDND